MTQTAQTMPDTKPAMGPEDIKPYLPSDFMAQKTVAVGLSGGPDSMALTKLLSDLSQNEQGPEIHALIIDHGLRVESAQEAHNVSEWVKDWPHVTPVILVCSPDTDGSRIQEEARKARYTAFETYCADHNVAYLCLAHHRNDQAETVLFRLSKGSGLDGLTGMSMVQPYNDTLSLIRPLLEYEKTELVTYCQIQHLNFVQDPSNEKTEFARTRLRQSADILAQEGLTAKRLGVTAKRLERAKKALESLAEQHFSKILIEKDTNRIVLSYSGLVEALDELAFRTILNAIRALKPERDYLPRMEKLEDLFDDMKSQKNFRKRTLGGLIFEALEKDDYFIISLEE